MSYYPFGLLLLITLFSGFVSILTLYSVHGDKIRSKQTLVDCPELNGMLSFLIMEMCESPQIPHETKDQQCACELHNLHYTFNTLK